MSDYLKSIGAEMNNAYVQQTIDNSVFRAAGLYSKEEIRKAKYNNFSRFGRILDPYGRLNDTREYLFFVKPDLHICDTGSQGLMLNPELQNNFYLTDFVKKYPNVAKQLQYSVSNGNPFANLLSFGVNSNLEIPGSEATTMDTPHNIFGVGYEYLGDSLSSDINPTFSLEFIDSKELEIYHFFKAYSEYHKERLSGLVTPPNRNYTFKKRLHNVMGIYKLLVDEDMETLIYWAYFWGVYPLSVPREAFSDPTFQDGLTFSINFKSAFFDDLDPGILVEFNKKMQPLIAGKKAMSPITGTGMDVNMNGDLPVGCQILQTTPETGKDGRSKYKIKWYA